jgi:hypothetical protein
VLKEFKEKEHCVREGTLVRKKGLMSKLSTPYIFAHLSTVL